MTHSTNTDALSPGGILMIIIAAIGLFSAFTMIVCLLALSRRRIRTETQIEHTLNRDLTSTYFRPFPPTFDSMHQQIRVRSLFGPCPSIDPKFEFRPPSYEEAVRMPNSSVRTGVQPGASNTLDLPPSNGNQRNRSPPPEFTEIDPLPRASVSSPACNQLFSSRVSTASPNIPTQNQTNHKNVVTISNGYNTFPTQQSNINPEQPNYTL